MGEEIFRKKSIERIKSPDELDDYVRVSNPSICLLLAAIIILLIGAFIWAAFGQIDSVVKADAVVTGGSAVCYIDIEEFERVELGMRVVVKAEEEASGTITSIESFSDRVDTCRVYADVDVPDGDYEAEIITESIKPLSFIFN